MSKIRRYDVTKKYTNKGEEEVLQEVENFCEQKKISRSWLTHCLYKQFLGLPLEEDEII